MSLLCCGTYVPASVPGCQRAREFGVSLSLGQYFAQALPPNLGGAHPERSIVYGTAPDGIKLELDVWRAEGIAADAPRPGDEDPSGVTALPPQLYGRLAALALV